MFQKFNGKYLPCVYLGFSSSHRGLFISIEWQRCLWLHTNNNGLCISAGVRREPGVLRQNLERHLSVDRQPVVALPRLRCWAQVPPDPHGAHTGDPSVYPQLPLPRLWARLQMEVLPQAPQGSQLHPALRAGCGLRLSSLSGRTRSNTVDRWIVARGL